MCFQRPMKTMFATSGSIILTKSSSCMLQITLEMNTHLSISWTQSTSCKIRDHNSQPSNILSNCTSLQASIVFVVSSHGGNRSVVLNVKQHWSHVTGPWFITSSCHFQQPIACQLGLHDKSKVYQHNHIWQGCTISSSGAPSEDNAHIQKPRRKGLGALTAGLAWEGDHTAGFKSFSPAATITLVGSKEVGTELD